MGIRLKLDIENEMVDCYVKVEAVEVNRYMGPSGLKIGMGKGGRDREGNPVLTQKYWLHIIYAIHKMEGDTISKELYGRSGQSAPYNIDDPKNKKNLIEFAYDWLKTNPRFKEGKDIMEVEKNG